MRSDGRAVDFESEVRRGEWRLQSYVFTGANISVSSFAPNSGDIG